MLDAILRGNNMVPVTWHGASSVCGWNGLPPDNGGTANV
jgi:hypothetical protein